MGIGHSPLDLIHHLVPKLTKSLPNVPILFLNYLTQNRRQLYKSRIVGVVVPRLNEDAIVRLLAEIGGQVVHYYRFVEGAPDSTQIFAEELPSVSSVLPVQPMRYPLLRVELVQNPVGVVLHRSCKDHQLVKFGHFLEESVTSGPYSKVAFAFAVLIVVNKCLIQI